jgi:hypothetical protein
MFILLIEVEVARHGEVFPRAGVWAKTEAIR